LKDWVGKKRTGLTKKMSYKIVIKSKQIYFLIGEMKLKKKIERRKQRNVKEVDFNFFIYLKYNRYTKIQSTFTDVWIVEIT